jgi:hypothetical protein
MSEVAGGQVQSDESRNKLKQNVNVGMKNSTEEVRTKEATTKDAEPNRQDKDGQGTTSSVATPLAAIHQLDAIMEVAHEVKEGEIETDGGRKAYLVVLSNAIQNKHLRTMFLHTGDFLDRWENFQEPERTGCLNELMNHHLFDVLSMGAVIADQAVSIWSANYALKHLTSEMPQMVVFLSYALNGFFLIELMLKLALHRWYFFYNNNWKLNWLDFLLVSYSFLETVSMSLSFLRVFRAFKVAKMVRMLKALTAFHDLRIMLDCLLGSFFGLFWSLVLIGVLMYIFALIFIQALTEHLITNGHVISPEARDDIYTYFGSVETAVLTTYKILTGGLEWGPMYALLKPAGWLAGPACLIMIGFFTVSVWNIITSVFIEKAMRLATPSIRELVRKQKKQAKLDAKEVAELIAKLDHDNDEVITKDEFVEICMNREIQEFLAVRELNIQNIKHFDAFFEMIAYRDTSSLDLTTMSGVSVDAVVEAFTHMKGYATAVDMNRKHFELFSMIHAIQSDIVDIHRFITNRCIIST